MNYLDVYILTFYNQNCKRNKNQKVVTMKIIAYIFPIMAVLLSISNLPMALGWDSAGSTWYGAPNGDGSDGGACQFGSVSGPPYSSMIAAGNNAMYNNGQGCGNCYMVRCTSSPSCSGNAVKVVITDLCPDAQCNAEAVHFDFSGTAVGAMAIPGREDELRNVGIIPVEYERYNT